MSEPDTAADYGDRDSRAAYSVLIELGQVLGAFRGKFVVVGGAVPWLLLPEAEPAHVGTLDIDLDLDPDALVGRDKKKDAYDIYYSVRNFLGGPERLAADCRPLLDNEIARKGFALVASKFSASDDFGPQTVRAFLKDSAALGGMTPEQVQEDAYRQVRAFLAALGILA